MCKSSMPSSFNSLLYNPQQWIMLWKIQWLCCCQQKTTYKNDTKLDEEHRMTCLGLDSRLHWQNWKVTLSHLLLFFHCEWIANCSLWGSKKSVQYHYCFFFLMFMLYWWWWGVFWHTSLYLQLYFLYHFVYLFSNFVFNFCGV